MKEQYTNYQLLPKGSIINLKDIIDMNNGTVCTIKAIEQDEADPSLYYYFLYANNEEKNNKTDPRIGQYFEFIEFCNPRIIPLSQPTMD